MAVVSADELQENVFSRIAAETDAVQNAILL